LRSAGQFVEDPLAKLEDRNVIDLFPNPSPVLSGRVDQAGLRFQLSQGTDAAIGCRKLILKYIRIGKDQRRDFGRGFAAGVGDFGCFRFGIGNPKDTGKPVACSGLADPKVGHGLKSEAQGFRRLFDDVIFRQPLLRPTKSLHQDGRLPFKPIAAFIGFRDNSVFEFGGFQNLQQLGRRRGTKNERINDSGGHMGDTVLYSLPGIAENDLIGRGNVLNLAFDDDTQATQLKQNIGTVLTVDVDGFGVGCDA
jgi:hypothetical protein